MRKRDTYVPVAQLNKSQLSKRRNGTKERVTRHRKRKQVELQGTNGPSISTCKQYEGKLIVKLSLPQRKIKQSQDQVEVKRTV